MRVVCATMGGTMHDCADLVADCRVRTAADVLGHTWNAVVIAALRDGPRRRVELREQIGGISDKVLTDTLRRLVAFGLVARDGTPPRVVYALTPLGETFADGPLRALGDWAVAHGDDLGLVTTNLDAGTA